MQGSSRGQGVVEYAGALVIAASIVALGLMVVPEQMTALFNGVINAAFSYFSSQLPT
ncbi:MAG TPA: hypothetical protein V6C52_08855 [Coleofasciculaceae cyanobacterium]|jgi:hypothetical protein